MNIYQKLQAARIKLQATKIKNTGFNKFAGYDYLTLGDFIPTVQKIFQDVGLCGIVSYTADLATLTIVDMDAARIIIEDGKHLVSPLPLVITITSPMGSAALKGCHEVQNIGAVETYQRRYLWVTAMEIVEHDVLDATMGADKPASMKTIVANDLADASDDERKRLEPFAFAMTAQFEVEDYEAVIALVKEATGGDPTQVNILRGLGDSLHWKALGVYRAKLKADATKLAQAEAVRRMNETPALGGKSDF